MAKPAITGGDTVEATDASSTATVTVPANTNAVVAFMAFWKPSAISVSALSVDSISMDLYETTARSGDSNGFTIGVIENYTGSTGDVACGWTMSADPQEGAGIVIAFIDSSTGSITVSDTASEVWEGGPGDHSVNVTPDSTDDLVLGCVESFNSTSPNGTQSGQDQTIVASIDDFAANAHEYDLVEEGTTDTPTTNIQGNGYYGVVMAIAVAEAAAGGTHPVGPMGHPLTGPFGGPI